MFTISALLSLNLFFFFLYISSPNTFPKPLSGEEEELLLERAVTGEKIARDKLIEHNMRLVAHVAKKYYNSGDQEDLISIGTIGLIKGVDSFKMGRGIRLATYCARCIENELLMYFRTLKKFSADISINEVLDSDKEGNNLLLYDILSGEDEVFEKVNRKINIEKLYQLLQSQLDSRELEILNLRYGLGTNRDYTQKEVAQRLDISRSYVSRIEKKALEKLREEFS